MNTNSYCPGPSIALLPLAIVLLVSSCGTGPGSRGNSHLTHDWVRSSYRPPQQESLRFRREARTASQDGNREVCGAILRDPGGDGTLKLVFAENESNGSHSYELSNSSVKRIRNIARSLGSGVIGSFHSHPASDATPGHNDISHAGVLSLLLIHSVPTGRTRLWQVVLRDGTKKAREVQLEVIGRRLRGASPLTPSPTRTLPNGEGLHDLRSR